MWTFIGALVVFGAGFLLGKLDCIRRVQKWINQLPEPARGDVHLALKEHPLMD